MKQKVKDGGLAFPTELHGYGGMSLRDYLAASAPIGNFISPAWEVDKECLKGNAELCYRWADAMLKAREETK